MTPKPIQRETLEAVLRAYGLAGEGIAVERAGGTAGMNIRLRTNKGDLFLRCRSAEHTRLDQVLYDHRLLTELAEQGLPVSPPIPTQEGKTYFQHGGRLFELFAWVTGEPFEAGNVEQLTDLGRRLAQLHAITATMDRRKDKPWEQDPAFLAGELDRLAQGTSVERRDDLLGAIRRELARLKASLNDQARAKLPQAIVHGDLHPGNALFADDRLAGLFDWDWANRQMRITDICDAVFFFARRSLEQFSGDDVWGMTCGFRLDASAAAALLEAYESVAPIEAAERRRLGDFMAARWLQERIRGMRKVDPAQRLELLDRGDLLDVLEDVKAFKLP